MVFGLLILSSVLVIAFCLRFVNKLCPQTMSRTCPYFLTLMFDIVFCCDVRSSCLDISPFHRYWSMGLVNVSHHYVLSLRLSSCPSVCLLTFHFSSTKLSSKFTLESGAGFWSFSQNLFYTF